MPFPISNIPNFIEKIESIHDFLETLNIHDNTDALVKFENQLALNELAECFKSPDGLDKRLTEFLANRWERIRHSSAAYTQQPLNKVNLLCLELANLLSPLPKESAKYNELEMGQGPYFLLMPSLTVHETLSYENIHHLKLHEFILSDNGELFIPLISSLELAFESSTGIMSHQMMDPSAPEALYPPLLTSNEMLRVAEHSSMVAEYYNLIQQYNQKRLHDSNLGTELDKLSRSLIAGGMHHGGQGASLRPTTLARGKGVDALSKKTPYILSHGS